MCCTAGSSCAGPFSNVRLRLLISIFETPFAFQHDRALAEYWLHWRGTDTNTWRAWGGLATHFFLLFFSAHFYVQTDHMHV